MDQIKLYEEAARAYLIERLTVPGFSAEGLKVSGTKTDYEIHLLIYGLTQTWHELAATELGAYIGSVSGDALVKVQNAWINYDENGVLNVSSHPFEREAPSAMVVSLAKRSTKGEN